MPADQTLQCQLDHLVICASNLDAGVSWFEQLSTLVLPFGGSHPLMATHNHLTALSEHSFLEIIANDPQAASERRYRWFNLDNVQFQRQLQQAPSLATWVVGTSDLEASLAALHTAGIDAGESVRLSRDDLQWHIALRSDGTLACDGVFPILIQWPDGVNPVSRMQNQGLRLNALSLTHPQADLVLGGLQAIGADTLVELQSGDVGLSAQMSVGHHHFQL